MKLKLGLALVAACALGLAFVFQGGQANPLATSDDTSTQWLCKSCTHSFLLTAGEVARRVDGDSRHWAPLVCPHCKLKQAYQALVCQKCETVYFGQDVPGESGRCPHCSTKTGVAVHDGRNVPGLAKHEERDASKSRSTVKVR